MNHNSSSELKKEFAELRQALHKTHMDVRENSSKNKILFQIAFLIMLIGFFVTFTTIFILRG